MAAIGQLPRRYNITSIINSNPCIVATSEENEFVTGDLVRLTDLNGMMPYPHGSDPLNNYKFEVEKLGIYTFYLRDPITHIGIDARNFPPYVDGGSVNLVQTTFIYYGEE